MRKCALPELEFSLACVIQQLLRLDRLLEFLPRHLLPQLREGRQVRLLLLLPDVRWDVQTLS